MCFMLETVCLNEASGCVEVSFLEREAALGPVIKLSTRFTLHKIPADPIASATRPRDCCRIRSEHRSILLFMVANYDHSILIMLS